MIPRHIIEGAREMMADRGEVISAHEIEYNAKPAILVKVRVPGNRVDEYIVKPETVRTT